MLVRIVSLSFAILSMLAWMPNIVFQMASLWFLMSIPFAVIGFCFAMAVKSKGLIIANVVMFFSIPIVIYGMYILEWIESI
ncbi:hypothetical protein BMT55_06505 [Listeria newyorkensis]|uniref:Uncharacterized protein n=2 Tax=Listeria newyorkensis TaxID=1497681 RepID=A0ABX4XN96_9LIST|nr:hypothetical protein BMT55_06505 [Listeria newyorkensis]